MKTVITADAETPIFDDGAWSRTTISSHLPVRLPCEATDSSCRSHLTLR